MSQSSERQLLSREGGSDIEIQNTREVGIIKQHIFILEKSPNGFGNSPLCWILVVDIANRGYHRGHWLQTHHWSKCLLSHMSEHGCSTTRHYLRMMSDNRLVYWMHNYRRVSKESLCVMDNFTMQEFKVASKMLNMKKSPVPETITKGSDAFLIVKWNMWSWWWVQKHYIFQRKAATISDNFPK